MNRGSSPGLGQWVIVALMVVGVIFLLFKLYEYGNARQYLPTGLTIAGVDVGGYTPEEAAQVIHDRYISAPVILYHLDDSVSINPSDAEFTLDQEAMLQEADYQRAQQDFWAGYWGFLWGRPIEVDMAPLRATHNRDALIDALDRISVIYDQPAQPPQPVPASLSFQYGAPGTRTNIEASLIDVENALYRPFQREARLVVETLEPERPDINLLGRLLVNHLDTFPGVASVFIMDLRSGAEVSVNAGQPMSGMSIVKLPIALEAMRLLDQPLSPAHSRLISETLTGQSNDDSANALLAIIAGEENPHRGAELVTESMRRLGLVNTFIAVPYNEQPRAGRATYETPANSRSDRATNPDPAMQTTADDMGTLLSMLYYCAEDGGGALLAAFAGEMTQEKCRQIVDIMSENFIGSLIEEGAPPQTQIAHRHGWIGDTHGDAGIVYSPGGDYVIVVIMHQAEWLEWVVSSPLIADVSRAAYNYFNFDNPYLSNPLTGQSQ